MKKIGAMVMDGTIGWRRGARVENEEESSPRAGVPGVMKGSLGATDAIGQGFLKDGVLGWMALNTHLLGGTLIRQEPGVDNALCCKKCLRITVGANTERITIACRVNGNQPYTFVVDQVFV